MKTCVVTATYGCAPNKVWLYMTNPTLNSWNPSVASAEVDLEGMHIVEKNKDGTTTDIHFDKLDKPRRISCTFTRGKIRGAFTAILLGSADSTSLECTLDVEGLGLFAKPQKKLEGYLETLIKQIKRGTALWCSVFLYRKRLFREVCPQNFARYL